MTQKSYPTIIDIKNLPFLKSEEANFYKEKNMYVCRIAWSNMKGEQIVRKFYISPQNKCQAIAEFCFFNMCATALTIKKIPTILFAFRDVFEDLKSFDWFYKEVDKKCPPEDDLFIFSKNSSFLNCKLEVSFINEDWVEHETNFNAQNQAYQTTIKFMIQNYYIKLISDPSDTNVLEVCRDMVLKFRSIDENFDIIKQKEVLSLGIPTNTQFFLNKGKNEKDKPKI